MNEEQELEYHTQRSVKNDHPIIAFWRKIGGGSLMIAAMLHVVILVIGLFWVLRIIQNPDPPTNILPGGIEGGGGGERGAKSQIHFKKLAAITPTSRPKRVRAENAQSDFVIPDPGDHFGEISTLSSLIGGTSSGLGGPGDGGGLLGGHGTGKGPGNGPGWDGLGPGKPPFGMIPMDMSKRCSPEDRRQRLHDNGGSDACEVAVVKALRWLKATQHSDGSWGSGSKQAMTGLALLAFFGHCETPGSDEFGETTQRGIAYLVDIGLKQDGHLSQEMNQNHGVYEHAIATYALAEAYTFCKEQKPGIPGLQQVVQQAGQYIIDNQNVNGGWAYKYEISSGHVDTSTTGWQVQALRACKHTSLSYGGMGNCIQKALKYLKGNQSPDGGFGYVGMSPAGNQTGGYYSLTGVGVLCNQMWDRGGSFEVSKGCRYIIEKTRLNYNGPECDLYAHYYESQAMMQKGGKEWFAYNGMFRDQLLNNQNADGSWKPPGGGGTVLAVDGGRLHNDAHYRTCLCTLMLEVYYRFLNSTGTGARPSRLDV